jgi:hypothetical protein
MPATPLEDTRITAKLPGLDVEIRHRELVAGDGEELTVRMRATPSFEAVGASLLPAMSGLAALHPMVVWTNMMHQAWQPWLRLMALPSERRDD